MQSIMQSEKECYMCGSQRALEKHHVFGGPNRKLSEKYGLTVWLCHWCHNEPPNGVHHNAKTMKMLRWQGQLAAMSKYGWTEDDFRKVFGRSYKEDK